MDYWIAIDKQKIGPLSLEEVRRRRLAPDTLVWHRGLPTWRQAGLLPELAGALSTDPEPQAEAANPVEPQQFEPQTPVNPAPPTPGYRPAPVFTIPSAAAPGPQQPQPVPEKPTTYLGWNIAAIILCCFIPAIVGLIYSLKVSSRYDSADYEGARRASETAGIWLLVSVVVGLVMLPFQILITIIGN